MSAILRHRGPDEEGFYESASIGLANARLSIIDLPGGRQPIHNETGTVHITFNGEIYNFQELRTQLEAHGHRFYTNSDTEAIVHLYEDEGTNFLVHLNGMFALALWDERDSRLILARDRMGIKPLYWAGYGGVVYFASEVKALLLAGIPREVDLEGLDFLINLSYIPGSKTLFKGIQKLEPGTYLERKEGRISITSYWDVPLKNPELRESQIIPVLAGALERSVRRQLVADVPIGAFLSGGLDTSSIVALAAKYHSGPLKTFCMGFGEETDEFADARLVAERFGTDHHELMVDASSAMKLYPKMIWHMEAPKINLYSWFVCEQVRKYVKVCLSGNGGDELFAGYYSRYRNSLRMNALNHPILKPLAKATAAFLKPSGSRRSSRRQNRIRALAAAGDKVRSYSILAGELSDYDRSELFAEKRSSLADSKPYFQSYFGKDDSMIDGLMRAELRTKLPNDLLSVDDSMSMAHSLELRVPLLDNELLDLMIPVPASLSYRKGTHGKLLLRAAVKDLLPEQTLRKPKWGFSVDIYSWYTKEISEIADSVLPDSDVIKEYFNLTFIRKILESQPRKDNTRYYSLIWHLLGFHYWHRIFIDQENIEAPMLTLTSLA